MKIKEIVITIMEYVKEISNMSMLPIIYEPFGYMTKEEEKKLFENLKKHSMRKNKKTCIWARF